MLEKSLRGLNLFVMLAGASGPIAIAEAALAQPQSDIDVIPRRPDASTPHPSNSSSPPATFSPASQPATTVTEWMAQIEASLVQITGIRLEATEAGLQVILETADGELAAPTTTVSGDALIATISNAVLALPEGSEFQQFEPAEGIALVQVTGLPGERVQVVITGTDAVPMVEIDAAATALTLSVVPGIAQAGEGDEAIQIVVTGEEGSPYLEPNTSTATRTDTPIRDIPQSIQVIPRQIIEEQQATSLPEVLENAAGVTSLGENLFGPLDFAIRGFDNAPVLRDGFILPGLFQDTTGPEVANLERVEVLRGPASVLYGQAEPGGVVNLVTKQPLADPYYNIQLQAGNRGFVSPSLDFSGPLTEDGRLRYRLNALYRREESFRDFNNDSERFFIAPTLAGEISDQTDLTVSLEYVEDNEFYDTGSVAFGEGIANVPPERVFNDPDSTVAEDFLSAGYILEHQFSDNWTLRNQFRYTSSSFDFGVVPFPTRDNPPTSILTRFILRQAGNTDTYSFYTNVQGEFNTGPLEHTLLFGVDLAYAEVNTLTFADLANPATINPIDIFDPTVDIDVPSASRVPILTDRDINANQLGIYLQDQIDILDNLILVAGLRYDSFFQEVIQNVQDTTLSQDESAITPRIGIVYQPIEPISLYANYSRTFAPNPFSTDTNGNLLDPEEGEGFEVGIRGEIVEDRLVATLAYFDITKRNVATTDPNDPLASITTGAQGSRGVDVNLTGEVLPGWNIIASYAYIDAEIAEDNTFPVGNGLSGIPEHSASLWTTYEIQSGDLQGLGFGLGFNFVGERQGDLENSFEVDSYFVIDAAMFYQRNNWQVRLNVDNLFDVDFVESVRGTRPSSNRWGEPLTVRASVSYTF
ncbi:MAG: TonB-dependent siderophore receptor [Cyanobacteria bacterium P01_C01_bin.118]